MFRQYKSFARPRSFIHKIYRNHLFGKLASDGSDLLMLSMVGIAIKAFATGKDGNQPGIKGAFKVQNVGTDLKASNVRN